MLEAASPPADGVADAYATRRTVHDTIMAPAAAGAMVRERFTVDELVMDGGRGTGIRGRAAGATTATEQARTVVGADGLHSRVARDRGAAYDARPDFTCVHYAYWDGLPVQGAALYARPQPPQVALVLPSGRRRHDRDAAQHDQPALSALGEGTHGSGDLATARPRSRQRAPTARWLTTGPSASSSARWSGCRNGRSRPVAENADPARPSPREISCSPPSIGRCADPARAP